MRFRRTLENKELLLDVLRHRQRGWSFPRIAKKFQKDHTTILYHCKKYRVEPGSEPITLYEGEILTKRGAHKRRTLFLYHQRKDAELKSLKKQRKEAQERQNKIRSKYEHLFTEKRNKGKSYREYLKEERDRGWRTEVLDRI